MPLSEQSRLSPMPKPHTRMGEHQLVGASNHSLDTAQRAEARDKWDTVAKAFNALTEEQRQVLMGRLILVFKMAS
jgi:hypothetical protein